MGNCSLPCGSKSPPSTPRVSDTLPIHVYYYQHSQFCQAEEDDDDDEQDPVYPEIYDRQPMYHTRVPPMDHLSHLQHTEQPRLNLCYLKAVEKFCDLRETTLDVEGPCFELTCDHTAHSIHMTSPPDRKGSYPLANLSLLASSVEDDLLGPLVVELSDVVASKLYMEIRGREKIGFNKHLADLCHIYRAVTGPLHTIAEQCVRRVDVFGMNYLLRRKLCQHLYMKPGTCQDWISLARWLGVSEEAVAMVKAFVILHQLTPVTAADFVLWHWQQVCGRGRVELRHPPVPCTLQSLFDLLAGPLDRRDLAQLIVNNTHQSLTEDSDNESLD